MINHYSYQTKNTDDAEDGDKAIAVLEADGVLARWNDEALESEIGALDRSRAAVDRRSPVAMRGHAGDEECSPRRAHSQLRAVWPFADRVDDGRSRNEGGRIDERGMVGPALRRQVV